MTRAHHNPLGAEQHQNRICWGRCRLGGPYWYPRVLSRVTEMGRRAEKREERGRKIRVMTEGHKTFGTSQATEINMLEYILEEIRNFQSFGNALTPLASGNRNIKQPWSPRPAHVICQFTQEARLKLDRSSAPSSCSQGWNASKPMSMMLASVP